MNNMIELKNIYKNSNFYEKIDTDSTASSKQQAQEGNYWDSFLNLSFDYDTRNQKFQATDGFRSQYFIDIPLISETATLQNTYVYKYFTELYENNISTASIFLRSSFKANLTSFLTLLKWIFINLNFY